MEIRKSGGNVRGREVFKRSGKRLKLFLAVFLLMFSGVAGAAVFLSKSGREKNRDFSFENMPGGEIQFTVSEEMILASGVTNMGIAEEVFEVENLTAGLEIEEVYIHSEDLVEEGTKVLKLSEESISDVREELEKTLREADLAYRAGKIEYEQSKITLQYEKDSKVLSGSQAKAVYEETLSGLEDSVKEAEKELEEAKEEITEYQSYVNDNSYQSYFKVDEYQTAYDETLDALKQKMDEWGVSWSQVTGGDGGVNTGRRDTPTSGSGRSDNAEISASGSTILGGTKTPASGSSRSGSMDRSGHAEDMSDGVSAKDVSGNNLSGETAPGTDTAEDSTSQSAGPGRDQIQVLASLYKVLEKHAQNLEQAEDDYEDAVVNAAFELQTLELKLPELEQKLIEAERNYQTELLQAKVTYEKALANAESAQSDYEAALRKAETNYEKLKSDREDAQENLALFEESVGDGCFYASGSGTVLRTMARAGGELTAESIIFLYSNPEEMTVTVSVNQGDIAKITLEDPVYIQTEEHGAWEGAVLKIDPVSEAEGRTNVTYSVVVKLKGETTAISANESVVAVFGMAEEEIREAISMAGESAQDAIPEGENNLENTKGKEMEAMEMPQEIPVPGEIETPGEMSVPEGTELRTDGDSGERVPGNDSGRKKP